MPTGVGTGPVGLNAPAGRLKMEIGMADTGTAIAVTDGHLYAPRWAVPELLTAGCTRIDAQTETINVRDELAATSELGDLYAYLHAHGNAMPLINPTTGVAYDIADVRTQTLALYDEMNPVSV